jgi:hypothetical protein
LSENRFLAKKPKKQKNKKTRRAFCFDFSLGGSGSLSRPIASKQARENLWKVFGSNLVFIFCNLFLSNSILIALLCTSLDSQLPQPAVREE